MTTFAQKLKEVMSELKLSQAQVARLAGYSPSAISLYLSGRREPCIEAQREIAAALGLDENYFLVFEPELAIQNNTVFNLPVWLAAKLMQKNPIWIRQGLQEGRFPWGYAVQTGRWNYWISSKKFEEYTGITIPINAKEVCEDERV